MSKATVLIPQGLRAFTHGAPVVTVSADTVGAALKAVDEQAHGFLARILTAEQELRPLVNIFVGEFSIREKGRPSDLPVRRRHHRGDSGCRRRLAYRLVLAWRCAATRESAEVGRPLLVCYHVAAQSPLGGFRGDG